MKTLDARLKKYAALAAGITGASVAADAQVEYTEVNETVGKGDFLTKSFDLNDDNVDDIYFKGYSYSSSWNTTRNGKQATAYSSYSSQYVFNKNQTEYKIWFDDTELLMQGDSVFENGSSKRSSISVFSNNQTTYVYNDDTPDEVISNSSVAINQYRNKPVYIGFKIEKGTNVQDCGPVIIAVKTTQKEVVCPTNFQVSETYYGWLKFIYGDVHEESTIKEQPEIIGETPIKGEALEAVKSAAELQTGLKFVGYGFNPTADDKIKIGEGDPAVGTQDFENFNEAAVLKLYPNPVQNQLNVISGSSVKSVSVFDMAGQMILTTDKTAINVADLSSGLYVVKVETTHGTSTQRFTKN